MAEADLSKIVNLIMENPKLIEEIKSLGKEAKTDEVTDSQEITDTKPETEETQTSNTYTPSVENINRIRRKDLLSALKPYVSEERGRAIESMMSIVDILDMMRSR